MRKKFTSSFVISALLLGTAAFLAAADQSPTPDPKIKVGDVAPDFNLMDQNRNPVKLSDFRGKKNVVVAFYVFAFTGG